MNSVVVLPLVVVAMVTRMSSVYVAPPKPYGTKNGYDWSFRREELEVRDKTSLPAPSSCRPLYVGSFIRHGNKNPTHDVIQRTRKLAKRLGGNILAPEFSHLNHWAFPFSEDQAFQMNDVGYREMAGLGRRWAERVTELLEGASEAEVGLFASPNGRTEDSAKGFREGLESVLGRFGDKTITINRTLVRYYVECDRYQLEVQNNSEAFRQRDRFMAGHQMAKLRRKLSERLQLNVSDLTSMEVFTLFTVLVTEEALLGHSPWADLWKTEEELKILDYVLDIKIYWQNGYGYPLTKNISCVVPERLFHQMDLAVQANIAGSSSHPKADFLIGHAHSLVPFQCLLGLFNDSTLPLTADNYQSQAGRTFQASRIQSMGASETFVLYECPPGGYNELPPHGVDWPPVLDRFMVQLLHKEMSIKIPNSCGYDLCPYQRVRNQFSDFIDKCYFKEWCALNKTLSDNMEASGEGNRNIASQSEVTSKNIMTSDSHLTLQNGVISQDKVTSKVTADSAQNKMTSRTRTTSREKAKTSHLTSSAADYLVNYLQSFLFDRNRGKS